MPKSPKQEARALSADERELVAKSRPPALQSLTDNALATLVKRTRERRNRARTVADRQRRELRGKARARGATPGRGNLAKPTLPIQMLRGGHISSEALSARVIRAGRGRGPALARGG